MNRKLTGCWIHLSKLKMARNENGKVQPGERQSDSLISLLNLLNSIEDSCRSSSRENATAYKSVRTNETDTTGFVKQKRITHVHYTDGHESNRYIWNDVHTTNIVADVDGSKWSHTENEDACSLANLSSTFSNIDVKGADSIPQKVQMMRMDLEKKTQNVRDLKATLARKKLASKRRIMKVHSDWKVRIDASAKAFEEVSLHETMVSISLFDSFETIL